MSVAASAIVCAATSRYFSESCRWRRLMTLHCLEPPFLFGNRQHWSDAPMLASILEVIFERTERDLLAVVGGTIQ